jgi:energy-coupling factor transport system ATP-binding protein
MPEDSPVPITIDRISFTYPTGITALQNVSLRIEPGESVAIVGENGAGKTTLARHINGLLRPNQGRVLIGDWDTTEYTTAKIARRVGYSFQNPDEQIFARTVRTEVAFGPRNLGFGDAEIEKTVDESLALVGLLDEMDHHPYDLQLAERKLLALAGTLAMRTPIIILDEPTTGQDMRSVQRIGTIIEALKEQGRTVLTISHDLDFCAEHFTRVIVMAGGRVIADGPARDVLSQADVLAQALVDPPQIVRLAAAMGFASTPLTVNEFVDLLKDKK